MKLIKILIISIFLFSCKKQESQMIGAVRVNVINAAINVEGVKVRANEGKMSYSMITDQVFYGTNKFYFFQPGVISINAINSIDTTNVLFNKKLNLKTSFYSIYIAGKANEIDTIFREEADLPFIKTDILKPLSKDSVVNIRFVNLSQNSPPLSVNIKNNVINEVNDLSYKTISSWNRYSAKLVTTNYLFEIRNAQTGDILFTYSFNATATNRFKCVSLIIKGIHGVQMGVSTFGISQINYF